VSLLSAEANRDQLQEYCSSAAKGRSLVLKEKKVFKPEHQDVDVDGFHFFWHL
jgi:hypothetical protein